MRVNSKLCMKKDLGLNNNLFGGTMLAWLDEASFIYANKVTDGKYQLVTKLFGEILFNKAVKEGDIVDFFCSNCHFGNSSIAFDIEVSIGKETVFKTSAIFVAVDNDGHKVHIQEADRIYKNEK